MGRNLETFLFDVRLWQNHSSIAESEDVELLCNILVVADQLLINRLKHICEAKIATMCKCCYSVCMFGCFECDVN